MDQDIKLKQGTPELALYKKIEDRIGRLSNQFQPASKYLLTHIFIRLDEITGTRAKIALLKTNPEEAKRRYWAQWRPLRVSEDALKALEPNPDQIPELEERIAALEQETADFDQRLNALESGDPMPMRELVLDARKSLREGRRFGEEAGINMPQEPSITETLLGQALEVLKKSH